LNYNIQQAGSTSTSWVINLKAVDPGTYFFYVVGIAANGGFAYHEGTVTYFCGPNSGQVQLVSSDVLAIIKPKN